MKCDQCEVARINGIACHEEGCPNSHLDPITGDPNPVECWECGFEFVPDGKVSRHALCPDCVECVYWSAVARILPEEF